MDNNRVLTFELRGNFHFFDFHKYLLVVHWVFYYFKCYYFQIIHNCCYKWWPLISFQLLQRCTTFWRTLSNIPGVFWIASLSGYNSSQHILFCLHRGLVNDTRDGPKVSLPTAISVCRRRFRTHVACLKLFYTITLRNFVAPTRSVW